MVKTYEQTLLEKGRLKGLEQGELKSLREAVIALIQSRFSAEDAEKAKEKLDTETDVKKLQSMIANAFHWKSIEDVWTISTTENS